MSTNQQNKEEEVDLGSLFMIIGNGFRKIFDFIGKIFSGIFHIFILILLFLKGNIVKLTIASIVGAAVGGYQEFKKEQSYGSDLLLQPNFNSARQLYDNVHYYNDLVEQKQYEKLSQIFDISEEEANSIRKFEVKPIRTSNDIIESYDELILAIDTATVKSYNFSQFKSAFTDFDYKIHQVHVEATDNAVFAKLDDVIISSIIENEYFNKIKNITSENLYRTDSLLRQNLKQVDTLRQVYMSTMLEEAKKESNGTNIDLAGANKSTKELELFQTNRIINKDLREVSENILEKSEVINVISNFQPIGYEIKGLSKNYAVIYASFGLLAMVVFLLLLKLNRFLKVYKNK